MKKIIIAVSILLTAALITSCGVLESKKSGTSNALTKTEAATIAPEDDHAIYNSDGNLMLISNNNRSVYAIENNYLIVSFYKSSVAEVNYIGVYDSVESANTYYLEHTAEINESGQYSKVVVVGKYIVFTVLFDNELYGHIYKETRDEVESEFSSYTKVK